MTARQGQWRALPARHAFALVTVLWVIGAAATVMLASATLASNATSAGSNRLHATRAFWRANDCVSRAQAAIDAVLSEGNDGDAPRNWQRLPHLVAVAGDSCEVTLEAAGTRLDVNQASEAQLRALFRAASAPDPDALADALLDWRDADSTPRSSGGEWEWYRERARASPRDGPLAHAREILLVHGFENGAYDSLLTVGPGRLSLNTAPLAVLASVPGLSEEIRLRIGQERANGRQVVDVLALAAGVSPQAERDLLAHYPDLVRLTTVHPDAWIVTAVGRSGSPGISAFIEMRLVRNGRRSGSMSWRSW